MRGKLHMLFILTYNVFEILQGTRSTTVCFSRGPNDHLPAFFLLVDVLSKSQAAREEFCQSSSIQPNRYLSSDCTCCTFLSFGDKWGSVINLFTNDRQLDHDWFWIFIIHFSFIAHLISSSMFILTVPARFYFLLCWPHTNFMAKPLI